MISLMRPSVRIFFVHPIAICLVAVFSIVLFQCSAIAGGSSLPDAQSQSDKLLRSFTKAIFPAGRSSRLLPPAAMLERLAVLCRPDQCGRVRNVLTKLTVSKQKISYISSVIGPDILLYETLEDIPDIPFDTLAGNQRIVRTGDLDCMLVQKLSSESTERFYIAANVKQSERALQSCIVFQYMRGMGVEFWPGLQFKQVLLDKNGGLEQLEETLFQQILDGAQVIMRLLTCPDLRKIRSRDEMLRQNSLLQCLR